MILVIYLEKEGNDLLAPYTNQIENLSVDDPLEISHESFNKLDFFKKMV